MNQNIEVINENLWAVNQEYVKQGYIKELFNLPNTASEKEDASLTEDGKIILNKLSPVYDVLKKMMPRIMAHSDAELYNCYQEIKEKQNHDSYERMYLGILGWEIKRRTVKAEYLKNLPKPTLKNKFMIWIREKVIKWQA